MHARTHVYTHFPSLILIIHMCRAHSYAIVVKQLANPTMQDGNSRWSEKEKNLLGWEFLLGRQYDYFYEMCEKYITIIMHLFLSEIMPKETPKAYFQNWVR